MFDKLRCALFGHKPPVVSTSVQHGVVGVWIINKKACPRCWDWCETTTHQNYNDDTIADMDFAVNAWIRSKTERMVADRRIAGK